MTSIVKYQNTLSDQQFIVISAKGGYKLINSFFREQNMQLPFVESRLFLDSANRAYTYNLVDDKPTFYYSQGKKVFKRVTSLPMTVSKDLKHYFLKHDPAADQIGKK